MYIDPLIAHMKAPIILILLLTLLTSCSTPSPQTSFYYWKTRFKLEDSERRALVDNEVKRLYLRYFDVGLEGGVAVPIGVLAVDSFPKSVEMVPVVYIKNEVFKKRADSLHLRVKGLIERMSKEAGATVNEVQFDCDWSEGTKGAYFAFLKSFKSVWGKPVSATIRLHQVKFRGRTGVPPVDRGVLMYYNMGKIGSEASSIYDRKTAARYTGYIKSYPLPLDVALPIFSWGVLMRGGKVSALLNKTDEAELQADTNFIRLREGRYAVKHPIFKGGYYLHEGDEVKVEAISEDNLEQMTEDLTHRFAKPPREVIFYDLDAQNLIRYDETIFKEVADDIR